MLEEEVCGALEADKWRGAGGECSLRKQHLRFEG